MRLAWYPVSDNSTLTGIDNEPDGMTNVGGVGTSFCSPGPQATPDCAENALLFPAIMLFDQDECYIDFNDQGVWGPNVLQAPIMWQACKPGYVVYKVRACEASQAFLNVLADWNEDGDWNDVLTCSAPGEQGLSSCAYEWAVKNAPISFQAGATILQSPHFQVGPRTGNTWLRVSLTSEPVSDDFPWAGSEGLPGGNAFHGGETEDYAGVIELPLPTKTQSWGSVKASYR